jgi:hypothetical protein
MNNEIGWLEWPKYIYVLLLILAIIAWPTSIWLALTIFIAVLAKKYQKDVADQNEVSETPVAVKYFLLKNIYDASVWVAVGLAVVTIAQILLTFAAEFVSSDTVLDVESSLSSTNETLGDVFGLKPLLYSILLLLLFSMIWPQIPILRNYLTIREWGGRLLLILITVTSFTFFSSNAINGLEKEWVASFHERLVYQNSRIRELQKVLVSTAWVEQKIKTLSPEDKDYLKDVIKVSSHRTYAQDIVENLAVKIGHSFKFNGASEIQNNSTTSILESDEKENLQSINEILKRYKANEIIEQKLENSKTLAIEASLLAITQLLPSELHPLGQVFVETLTKSVMEGVIEKLSPSSVTDFEGAINWAKFNLIEIEPFSASIQIKVPGTSKEPSVNASSPVVALIPADNLSSGSFKPSSAEGNTQINTTEPLTTKEQISNATEIVNFAENEVTNEREQRNEMKAQYENKIKNGIQGIKKKGSEIKITPFHR